MLATHAALSTLTPCSWMARTSVSRMSMRMVVTGVLASVLFVL